MIKPINGLDMANQSGIASRKGSKSRVRLCEGAFVRGKSVVWPVPQLLEPSGSPYGELIVFTPHDIGNGQIAANARGWDFVIPLSR